MEKNIFVRVMKIGLIALEFYFAEKGSGYVGSSLTLEDGTPLRPVKQKRSRKYFSIFGRLDVFRTYYPSEGKPGVFPLDAAANLPRRSYSYSRRPGRTHYLQGRLTFSSY
jgi:hypothetical protein